MLTAETKKHIDAARQVLVGVVPNPSSQIDQITNALIYKFMDDMDQMAIKAGGKASFFIGDLERYAWTRLMDTRLGSQERMNLYSEALAKFGEAKQLPELFRDIFKRAFLPYRIPEVLSLFLREITYFDYVHSEELGNAFEYLLSIMGSQGDAGQFRTPRHIIDFIVEVVDPSKNDRVLDPACGTAGFLISAYKHILAKHDGKSADSTKNDEKPLTASDKVKLTQNFEGYDVSPEMVRLSKVNMYLHQFKNPNIYEYNTLAQEERWNDKYDVILANPPFMTPKGGMKTHSRFSIQATKSEVLFVDYIVDHLRPKGRAGIIVPEGIIFNAGGAFNQLRKKLVEDGLWAVVSLPKGIFNPYSPVQTSVLLFDSERAKSTNEILFLKIEKDGYHLGKQRRPLCKDNDDKPELCPTHSNIPEALKILSDWKKGIKSKSKISLYVERSKIKQSGEYYLSADRYRESKDYPSAKWALVELGEVLDYKQPTDYIVESIDYSSEYSIPVLTAGKTFILGYTNEEMGVFRKDLPVIIFDDFTTATKFVDFPFKVKSSAMKILLAKKDKANIRYVYNAIQNIDFTPGEHKRHWISQFSKFKIPLPPLEVQEQIVAELDGYQRIISGAKQIVENWKPKIDTDTSWEKVKLGEVCETSSGGTPLKSHSEYYDGGTIPWLRSGEVAQGIVNNSELFITEEGLKNSSAKMFPVDTVLVAMYGATAGEVGLLKFESTTNQAVCGVLPCDKYVPEFLYYALLEEKEIMVRQAGGGAQPNISQNIIRTLVVPLPSLEVQRQIVERIGAEQALVESSKKLIDLYEQKTKDVIAKLWSE